MGVRSVVAWPMGIMGRQARAMVERDGGARDTGCECNYTVAGSRGADAWAIASCIALSRTSHLHRNVPPPTFAPIRTTRHHMVALFAPPALATIPMVVLLHATPRAHLAVVQSVNLYTRCRGKVKAKEDIFRPAAARRRPAERPPSASRLEHPSPARQPSVFGAAAPGPCSAGSST